MTLWANFLADGGIVFTLATVASIAHKCETNSFTAFWFWAVLAATINILAVLGNAVPLAMVAALAASAYVVFTGMLPDRTHEAKYVELKNS